MRASTALSPPKLCAPAPRARNAAPQSASQIANPIARAAKLAADYGAKGVKFVGVNSNKSESGTAIAEHSRKNGFTFAVLKDKGNVIADRFDARATPETYVVNGAGELVYHGQIDNSQTESQVETRPLAAALDAVTAGRAVDKADVAAFGCSIKRE